MTPDTIPRHLTLVAWNIHRARGNDGRVDPVRTADVLLAEVCAPDTDVLVLVEADAERPPHQGLLDIGRIEQATRLRSVHDDPRRRWAPGSDGFLGVVVLLHPKLAVEEVTLLDLPGRCHRGAVVVDAADGDRPFRIVATHLSLGQPLRIAQMRTIGQHLFRRAPRQPILCGDLNEWRPWGGLALGRWLVGADLRGPARPTFPARRPLLPLDRVLTAPPGRVEEAAPLDGPGIRRVSDHRPIRARVRLAGAP